MTKHNTNAGSRKLLKYKTFRVSPDGSYIENDGQQLTIVTDKEGNRYADSWWDRVYIDEVIALAHRFKRKLEYERNEGYYIAHKDGDLNNNDPDNLEWKRVSETVQTTAGHVYFDGYTVGKDGSIIVTDGKITEKGQPLERNLDTDLDAVWPYYNPLVVTYEVGGGLNTHRPDEYMAKAGYVAGDKTALKDPVVLHRDKDVGNYNYDNLMWVESDDPRYIEYDALRKQRHQELLRRYNKVIPPCWL